MYRMTDKTVLDPLRQRLLKAYSERADNSYAVLEAPDLYEVIGILQDLAQRETAKLYRPDLSKPYPSDVEYRGAVEFYQNRGARVCGEFVMTGNPCFDCPTEKNCRLLRIAYLSGKATK